MTNALSPPAPGSPQRDAEARNKPGPGVQARQEKAARAHTEWARQDRVLSNDPGEEA